MTAQDAYYWNSVREAKHRVRQDPTLTLWDRSKIISQIDRMEARPAPDGRIPFRSVMGALVGGGLGYGAAALGSKFLGLSDGSYHTLTRAGFGLGALMNSGMVKLNSYTYADHQQDRINAYRTGFLKQAAKCGYFDKKASVAPMFVVTPSDVSGAATGALSAGRGVAGRLGSILGAVTSPSESDASIAEIEAEGDLLRQRLREILRSKSEKKLTEILRRRQHS